MLNKSTSKRRNLWKLSFVIPVLALFLWSFNVNEVVKYKEIEIAEPDKAVSYGIPSEKNGAQTHEDLESLLKSDKSRWNSSASNLNEGINKASQNGITVAQSSPIEKATVNSLNSYETNVITTSNYPVGDETARDKKIAAEISYEFKYTITKNTTNAQLEEIKTELKKEYNIDLKYKVERNSSNEIVAINISYTDNKGGSGNYSINNDDEPIDDFVFFLNEDGERGFWSEEQEERRAERMETREMERAKRMADRAKRMREREVEMVERKESLENRQVKMKKEMKERMNEMKDRQKAMIEREKELVRNSNKRARRSYRDAKEIEEKIAREKGHEVEVYSDGHNYHYGNGKSRTYVYSSNDHDHGTFVITKDTSDKELSDLQRTMEAEGITFNYSKVKRNSLGEITRIKITTKNDKGSKSVISSQADDGEPINEIIIQN